ncbi:alpha/beta fold hydrolase [Dactylosporangium sp. CA-092794]|uniref:alpha/beta fold hydrolase n=1 Tax=Dactylosporangium sp. CA-092794 TaxID=3239929 RepID=UPI003D8E8FA9
MSSHPLTFVLVPGAYQGGWSWQPVAQRLRAAGHAAVVLTLPGLADGDPRTGWHLSDAVDHVVDEVERRDLRSVVLVAQSWGGYPVTGAAHRLGGRIAAVVYYNAIVPARGVPLIAENPDYREMLRAAIEASPDGSVAVTPDQMPLLAPEWDDPARQFLYELLVPQPGAYYTEALDVDPVTELGLPVAYIASENDLVLARPGPEYAARLGILPVTVPGGHESMLTRPDDAAAALLAISEKWPAEAEETAG